MAAVCGQADQDVEVQKYLNFLEDDSTAFRSGAKAISNVYTPRSVLLRYFTAGRNSVEELLKGTLQERAHTIPGAEDVLKDYLVVFTILLKIGKAQFLVRFIERNYSDERLPFFDKPRHFPKAESGSFFDAFSHAQWRFCPVKLPKNSISFELEPEQILPLRSKQKVGEDANSTMYRVELHEDYDSFVEQSGSSKIDLGMTEAQSHKYVFKEFARNGKGNYDKDLTTFLYLQRSGLLLGKTIRDFYGSFVQDDAYTIVLENSDYASLNDYVNSNQPPTNGDIITHLWEELLRLHETLHVIHNLSTPHCGEIKQHSLLRGRHQNLTFANVGVFSNHAHSEYDREFRLTNLGIMDKQGFDETYAAPECRASHFDVGINLQMADVWSLGCIYSEFAIWLTLGLSGLKEYRARRMEQCRAAGMDGVAAFHSRQRLLPCVSAFHDQAIKGKNSEDRVTEVILQQLVEDMLCEDGDARPTIRQLKVKINRILTRAREQHVADMNRKGSISSSKTGHSNTTSSGTRQSDQQSVGSNTCGESSTDNGGSVPARLAGPAPRKSNSTEHDAPVLPPAISGEKELYLLSPGEVPLSSVSPRQEQQPLSAKPESMLSTAMRGPDGSDAPEALRLRLDDRSSIRSGQDAQLNPALMNGFDKEIVMSQATKELNNPKPCLSITDGLTWLNDRKGNASSATLRGESYLDTLADRDFVFLIDDSASMRAHREMVSRAVRLLSWLLKKYDQNGMELHFMQKTQKDSARPGHTSDLQRPLLKTLDECKGKSDVSIRLNQILSAFRDRTEASSGGFQGSLASMYINVFEQGIKSATSANKLMVYVFTDGNWEDGATKRFVETAGAIAATLKMQGAPKHAVGIQFIRVEEKAGVIAKLQRLKSSKFANRISIDTQPLEGNLFRLLLGPVSDLWNNEWDDNDLEAVPPQASGVQGRGFASGIALAERHFRRQASTSLTNATHPAFG